MKLDLNGTIIWLLPAPLLCGSLLQELCSFLSPFLFSSFNTKVNLRIHYAYSIPKALATWEISWKIGQLLKLLLMARYRERELHFPESSVGVSNSANTATIKAGHNIIERDERPAEISEEYTFNYKFCFMPGLWWSH